MYLKKEYPHITPWHTLKKAALQIRPEHVFKKHQFGQD
jgi:hypothetical protein